MTWWRRVDWWVVFGWLVLIPAAWGIAAIVARLTTTLELLAGVAVVFLMVVVQVLIQVGDLGRWFARRRGQR